MRSRPVIGDKAAVEPSDEHEAFEVERRPSVEQETQAKIDYADERALNGRLFGQTLEAEERMRARAWEVARTRARWDRWQDAERERRTREAVEAGGRERRRAFRKRAASVDPWADPDRSDAREQLPRETLAVVNREAARMAERLAGVSTAAISNLVARRVVDGQDVASAVVATMDELRTAPGQMVPIGRVAAVRRREVDIEGTVVELWNPSHPSIQQVGLLADDTGRIKFTAWRKSRVPIVELGHRVRFRNAAKNWYRGRVSVALTGRTRVVDLGASDP